MASGHQVRREDETGEAARLKGAVKCDGDMLNALTQEGSALAKGAMPAVHAATETGKKKLLEGMADAAVKVAKTKKKTDDKPKSEQALLEGMSDDSFYQNLFKSLDEKKQWHEKAKADLKARKQMHRFTRYYRSAAGNTGYLDRLYLPRRKLTLANLHTWGNEDYAELGSKFKAAHVKIMLWWLAKKTQIITDESDGDHLLTVMAACCFGLGRFVEVLDHAGLVLSTSESSEASRCLFLFLRSYQFLALHFQQQRLLVFKMRPKHHYLWHTACEIREYKINQRMFHTWDDESFLGKLKYIARHCHGRTMSRRLFDRYLLAFGVFLKNLSGKNRR
ncbi:unnamed protein product [Effrenium voratum]|nr:unnamed protein product [Effrenium voratum]